MVFLKKLHMLHSAWHYRLNTEKNDIRFLLDLNLTGKTVIDIGANRGIYSYWMSKKVGPEGKVIAFEPQPELETHLLEFKSSFKLGNLFIIRKGLSSRTGSQNLFRSEPGSGGASLNKSQASDEWKAIPVSVTTLDSYYDEFMNVAFIKCDVEGHEQDVFKGGRQLLERDKPCLLFECHRDEAKKQNLFSYLISLGYDGFFTGNTGMIHFSQFDKYPYRRKNEHHRNYIFLHPDFIRCHHLEKRLYG
jgi:FkbM family methyltransferase